MWSVLCFGLAVQALGLSVDLQDPKVRPTTKVVGLLKGMQKQLDAEAKADEETFEKFKCWCTENTEGKARAIKIANRATKDAKERVASLLAKSERLVAEIHSAEDGIQKNEAALSTATALRKQQKKEFESDRDRIQGDLTAVENANATIGNAPAQGLFLQVNKFNAVKPMLISILDKHSDRISSDDNELMQAFLQSERGNGVDTVVGVLNGLEDDFTADMKSIVDAEAAAVKAYEELAKAKTDEIQAGIAQVETKKEEKADADEERAHKKQEIKDLEAELGVDTGFVEEVKKQCADMDQQWDERQAVRAEETKAISKAIETLDSDEAHANFAKTISFLQESEQPEGSTTLRQRAADTLTAGAKLDQRLVTLAMSTKIDKFTNVKKAMDDMVASIKQQIADEVEQRDFCTNSFRDNQLQTEDKTRSRDHLQAAQDAIDLVTPSKKIQLLQDDVVELKKQLQLASQNREKENEVFQKEIPEQRETQRLLKKAYELLGKFYNKGAFVQLHTEANPEAPAGFKDYKANGQSYGVMGMIQQLITESEASEKLAEREEASAQKAYEKFATETTAAVEVKEKAIAGVTATKAKLELKLVQTRKAKEAAQGELDVLASSLTDLHESCDFLIKNFDYRQEAMSEEIESVNKAKAILSGATFAEIQLD